jgi:predicted aspartyl protease
VENEAANPGWLTGSALPIIVGRVLKSIRLFLVCLIFLGSSSTQGAVALSALDQYVVAHGYAGAQFIQHENTYRLPIIANGVPGDLTIDTGSPCAVVFLDVLKKFKLTGQQTNEAVRGAFGKGEEKAGVTTIHQLAMGNCTLMNVEAAVASDPRSGGLYRTYGATDGLFGLSEMLKYGAVLDLSNHLLLVNPRGQTKSISSGVRSILTKQGYTPVEMSIRRGHLHVGATINGVACQMVVDTGAFLTVLDQGFARKAHLGGYNTGVYAHGFGVKARPIQVSQFPEFKVGDFLIKSASVTITSLNPELLSGEGKDACAGLLGAEYLGLHGAIFDFTSGTLYLRPKSKS